MYSSESNKWKAYQFSDPFATSAFVVCNKVSKVFCRPDCDARPITNLKSEIKFVESADDALNWGFTPCKHCDPCGVAVLDVSVLMSCVSTINKKIGFMMPLVDENEDVNNTKIKQNILDSKKSNEERILEVIDNGRRSSLPNVTETDINLSKNDSDHYRLVDLACRHLAHAAAVSLFLPGKVSNQDLEDNSGERRKKRRRGGVLGFKELAAKSKLSAWHFHRVFKSVTGLTPKTYGDKCHEFLERYREKSKFKQASTPISSSPSPDTFQPPMKKMKLSTPPVSTVSSDLVASTTPQTHIPSSTSSVSSNPMSSASVNWGSPMTQLTPELSPKLTVPESNFMFDFNKAVSVPDFTKMNAAQSLFPHNKYQLPQTSDGEPQALNSVDFFGREFDLTSNQPSQLSMDPLLDIESLPANLEAQLAPSMQMGNEIQDFTIPEIPNMLYDANEPISEYDFNENLNAANYEFLSSF